MLHAIVMAGGSGTRFWPASRRQLPKQLLRLVGDRTMIQSTVDRLDGLVAPDHVRVITNEILVEQIRSQLPSLPAENVVGEPCKRDTAPCVGLAAAMVVRDDPDGIMAVLPADHVIATNEQFQAALRCGVELVEQDASRIVTFGIPPTYPAESFGYIERADAIEGTPLATFDVARFREKPDRMTAEAYLRSGSFYWNSGIFLWKASTILAAIQQFEPTMYAHIESIAGAMGTDNFSEVLKSEFAAIEGKSIDFAVMERHKPVIVIETPFSWDDVGSWQSIARMNTADQNGNIIQGQHVGVDTTGTIIRCEPDHTIVTIGINDMIIVQTPDATLIAPRKDEERVREIVKKLGEEGRDDLL